MVLSGGVCDYQKIKAATRRNPTSAETDFETRALELESYFVFLKAATVHDSVLHYRQERDLGEDDGDGLEGVEMYVDLDGNVDAKTIKEFAEKYKFSYVTEASLLYTRRQIQKSARNVYFFLK